MDYQPYQFNQNNNPATNTPRSVATETKTSFAMPNTVFPPHTSGGTPAFGSSYSNNSSSSSAAEQSVPVMSTMELTELRKLVEDVCGIHLEADKQYLLETRLLKLLLEYNCNNYTQLIQLCRGAKQQELRPKLVDLMTTKETMWFRDEHPYETLKLHILPELLKKRSTTDTIRIWSAACSTGQEPYSISICVNELANASSAYPNLTNGQRLRIKGTDIAPSSIMLSKMARYDMVAMGRGISETRKSKFFTQQGRAWTVNDEVKKLVDFELTNLQSDLSNLGQFDIIFMRNVAIYFSKEFKIALYAKLAKQLKPDGYLIIGSTESMVGLDTPFKLEMHGKTSYYRLK
jgi:chemotaxis protein methyltransferase CheR